MKLLPLTFLMATSALAQTNTPWAQPVTAVPFESTIISPQPTAVTPQPIPAPTNPNNVQEPPVTQPSRRPPLYANPPTGKDLVNRALAVNPAILRNPQASFPQSNVVTQPIIPTATSVSTQVARPVAPPTAMPAHRPIQRPVMFDTPEADELLSTLQIFPPDNPWHQEVSNWPVSPDSTKMISRIGPNRPFRYNLDMCFILVPPDQPRTDVKITMYASELNPGPYPVPDNVPIEGWPAWYRTSVGRQVTLEDVQRDSREIGGDRHAIVVDPANRMLYEFFALKRTFGGWTASQASIFDMKTNRLRPDGWTSADAAGLPILPAVVRYDELKRGQINHALRVTLPETRNAYVRPATHYASKLTDPDLPRMGERLRLRADFDETGFSAETRTILVALKRYGMFVADNGSLFAISVAPDERMPSSLGELERLHCSDFEVVTAPK